MKRKSKWTVLLLRPDYAADTFGHDTFLDRVMARTPAEALRIAQANACHTDNTDVPEDYFCLLCSHGHLQDLSDRGGGVGVEIGDITCGT